MMYMSLEMSFYHFNKIRIKKYIKNFFVLYFYCLQHYIFDKLIVLFRSTRLPIKKVHYP